MKALTKGEGGLKSSQGRSKRNGALLLVLILGKHGQKLLLLLLLFHSEGVGKLADTGQFKAFASAVKKRYPSSSSSFAILRERAG